MNEQTTTIVNQSVRFLDSDMEWTGKLGRIAELARVAYRSVPAKSGNEPLLRALLKSDPKHTSPFEHAQFSVIVTTNRAIANELVRHRHCAFTQESTRYVNFNQKPISFVLPLGIDGKTRLLLEGTFENLTGIYASMIKDGIRPEVARDVLPHALATTLAITTNIAEWRSIFSLRCDIHAHPMARAIGLSILKKFHTHAPFLFEDQFNKFILGNSDAEELLKTVTVQDF